MSRAVGTVEQAQTFSIKHSPLRQHFNGAASDVYGPCAAGVRSSALYSTIQSKGIDQIAWKECTPRKDSVHKNISTLTISTENCHVSFYLFMLWSI